MRRLLIALVLGWSGVLLGACAGEGPSETARQRGCDDGGSGGVVIDGVCL